MMNFMLKTEGWDNLTVRKVNLKEELIKCATDDEVIKLLSGIRYRGIFLGIIIDLLNEIKILKKENKKEMEIEILW